jgi:sugar phosphate isomerase/epimerase
MQPNRDAYRSNYPRRAWLKTTAAGLGALAAGAVGPAALGQERAAGQGQARSERARSRSRFQVACMTLPYARFPLKRALSGLQAAGYQYVAWGTTHDEGTGKRVPVLAEDAPLEKAKELGQVCRDLGLEPLMMFGPSPEALDRLKHRVRQAGAAGVGQVLTMGNTRGNDPSSWIKNFKEIGPLAREQGVTVVVKQHGGNTGTGEALAAITRAVGDEGIKISYDAGNVMDYLDINPLPDLEKCAGEVRSFCIKDHRNFPRDQDCGPGFGEIDHYKLLHPVAFTGLTMPLACENIFAPLVPRPDKPEGVDALAKRAREFLDVVVAGLQAVGK